ncbi:hypothetical protein B0H34DRAFT_106994 [Crassisporium funariophilum]|nr:hypothetical protein B0H34DRAFT_106994 [Crassisporium funariophilum]
MKVATERTCILPVFRISPINPPNCFQGVRRYQRDAGGLTPNFRPSSGWLLPPIPPSQFSPVSNGHLFFSDPEYPTPGPARFR